MEKQDKRCAIMRALLELVAEQGFHGAPIAAVAERAGVAAGTIYRYFENKDILIGEAYRYIEQSFYTILLEEYPATGSIRDRYLHIGKTMIRYCLASPLKFRFLEQFHNSPYGAEHRRDKIFGKDGDIIADLFNEAKAARLVKELPLAVLFALSFGPLMDICRDHILGFVHLDDPLVEHTVTACWDAVRQ